MPKLAEALTILLSTGAADGPRQALAGLVKCEGKLGRKRTEELMKEAGLDDAAVSDLLGRIDETRQKQTKAKS